MSIDVIDTHNLLDGKAEAKGRNAQAALFTEAPPDIFNDKVNDTHRLFRHRRQRDLVIALRDDIASNATRFRKHYKLVHGGVEKVTPHRGILWITFRYEGKKYAIICEHRINAWYAPWIRGEKEFRWGMWHKHTAISNRIQARLIERGFIVIAGGDPNAPEGTIAYPLLHETKRAHLDRVAAVFPISGRAMSKDGSDHHRLRGIRKAA